MDKYPLYYQGGLFAEPMCMAFLMTMRSVPITLKPSIRTIRAMPMRDYREAEIQGFADMVEKNLDIAAILQALQAD